MKWPSSDFYQNNVAENAVKTLMLQMCSESCPGGTWLPVSDVRSLRVRNHAPQQSLRELQNTEAMEEYIEKIRSDQVILFE